MSPLFPAHQIRELNRRYQSDFADFENDETILRPLHVIVGIPKKGRVPRRSLNPLDMPDLPNPATDPDRIEELVRQYQFGLALIKDSYLAAKSAALDGNRFNEDLRRLKAAVGRPKRPGVQERRLHADLELMIGRRAREIARKHGASDDAAPTDAHVQTAARQIASETKARRKRPPNDNLRFHAEALMALIQHYSGMPVTASREKNSVYGPRLSDGRSRDLATFFEQVDPTVTETALVNIVRAARRKYAGKPMRFVDFFPFLSPTVLDQRGWPVARPGLRVEHFELVPPIYCP